MSIKKILAGAAASVMALSLLAAAASAETLSVDESKVLWGDPEGKGNLRIEFFNAYGSTSTNEAYDPEKSPVNPEELANVTEIAVTFTLSGAPEGDYEATLGFADGSWAAQDWESTIPVTGDGTYTITSSFAPWQDEMTGEDIPAQANGIMVFVIDIKQMGADAGIETSDDVPYQMDIITVSDISIDLTVAEPEEEEPAESEEPEESEAPTEPNDSDGDNAAAPETSATTTTTTAASNSNSGSSDMTPVIIGIIVGVVVVVIIIVVVVVAKKKK